MRSSVGLEEEELSTCKGLLLAMGDGARRIDMKWLTCFLFSVVCAW